MVSYKKPKTRIFLVVLLLIIFLLTFLTTAGREFFLNFYSLTEMENLDMDFSNCRLMVIAPHNDDEALSCAALISHVIKAGGKVKVAIITNGDGHLLGAALRYLKLKPGPGDYLRLAYLRQGESVSGMGLAGLTGDDIVFLGYPDGGLYSMLINNWDGDNPYISKFTGLDHSPYRNSMRPGVGYWGKNLVQDLEKLLLDFSPTIIVYPHPNDRHSDHVATNSFVNYVLENNGLEPVKYLYLVHRGKWPSPFGHFQNLFLVPPFELLDMGTTWYKYELDRDDIRLKSSIIRKYKSQTKITGPFLKAFIRKNELFGEYPVLYDTGEPLLILEDPVNGNIKAGDIKSVYLYVSAGVFEARINMAKGIASLRLDLIFFPEDRQPFRINIMCDKRTEPKIMDYTRENIIEIPSVYAYPVGEDELVIGFLTDDIPSFESVMVSLSTLGKRKVIDRTAVRILRISDPF